MWNYILSWIYPNPALFGMDGRLIAKCNICFIMMFVLTLLFYIWFYFMYTPKPNALKIFWVCIVALLVISIFLHIIYVNYYYDDLRLQNVQPYYDQDTFVIHLMKSGFIVEVILAFVLYLIFMLVYLIIKNRGNIHWGIKAMRNYPIVIK